MASELLEFPQGVYGMALNIEEDSVGAVILGPSGHIKEGDEVKRTFRIMEVPVGGDALRGGRVVNPVGGNRWMGRDRSRPIYFGRRNFPLRGGDPATAGRHSAADGGIKAIDTMLPIGRGGQRELIIGDRQIGKRLLPWIQLSTRRIMMLTVSTWL